MAQKKFSDVDFYAVLGVQLEDDENVIRKAYRKKALDCHPDKNPDNPKAAELFHELSKALEILTDKAAKTAYDKVWKAKKASELRHKQLDSKRLKLKEDLEKRERESEKAHLGKEFNKNQETDENILKAHIERLRREGSRLLEEEQTLLKKQLQKSLEEQIQQQKNHSVYRLKIKWRAQKNDPLNGGYSNEVLISYLKKYGNIIALVMSKKRGSAMVEFDNLESAEMALAYEKALLDNPVNLEWVVPPTNTPEITKTTVNSSDYEDLVMRKLRQAKERQELIERMQKEDLENSSSYS